MLFITHDDWDGAGCILAVEEAVRRKILPETPSIITTDYDCTDAYPVDGQDVIFADFCPTREILLEVARTAKSVRVIDHHRTTCRLVGDKDARALGVEFIVDFEHAGCILTWDYLMPSKTPYHPTLLHYIEDHDLWRFKLPESRAARAYIQSYKPSRVNAAMLRDEFDYSFPTVVRIGEHFVRSMRESVERSIRRVRRVEFAGFEIDAVNATEHMSEVGERMLQRTDCAFVAIWLHKGDNFLVSLRSHDKVDVSRIAEGFGGGGHTNAAGFHCSVLPFAWPAPVS